ncbi:MAG: ABC transporter permease subunit [Actinomycetia bacterium]|nr:ABC transporter permease subunit [Actinomycetes bacterium]
MSRPDGPGAVAWAGVLGGLLVLPVLLLFAEAARHGTWPPVPVSAWTATSLAASALALGITVAGGTPLAWYLARLGGRGRLTAELVLSGPLLLPPLVLGLVLAYVLGPERFPHLGWDNTFAGLVVAEVYEAAPYYVFVAWAALGGVAPAYWDAAATLGFAPTRTLFQVALPLAAPELAVGAAMAWSRAMGAFGAPIVLSYHPMGLPVGIWVTLEEFGLSAALPLALLLVAVAWPLPLAALGWARRAAR